MRTSAVRKEMRGDQLKDVLGILGWSQRALAEVLRCDDRLVRRWIAGSASIPPEVTDWLEGLGAFHKMLPPPLSWRRRSGSHDQGDRKMSDAFAQQSQAAGGTAPGEDGPSFDLQDVGWDWRPDGQIVARGKLCVTRGDDIRPVVLSFELPLNGIPPVQAMKNPRDWVVNSLRRALRR